MALARCSSITPYARTKSGWRKPDSHKAYSMAIDWPQKKIGLN